MAIIYYFSFIRKKKKEEARKAEQSTGDSEDDCSASPKCKRPTGKQVRTEPVDGDRSV